MEGTRSRWQRAVRLLSLLALVSGTAPAAHAQPQVTGQWRTLPETMPINPIHLSLLYTGRILVVAGSGNVATSEEFLAGVWDPDTRAMTVQTTTWDMFCNGMVVLPDGRVFINGGNLAYDPFLGEKRNAIYDPATDRFTDIQDMARGRWYPTVTTLGDGRILTFSGLLETGGTNKAVEIYDPATGWSPEYRAGWTPPLYPRLHLLPNGKVLYTGSTRDTRTFDPVKHKWSSAFAHTNYTGSRKYGTSVLLALGPEDGYRARVIIMGGGNPATATTELLDMSAATPQWQYGPPMSQPRVQINATLLPDGRILTVGGSRFDEDELTASLKADLYDPATNTFSSAGANAVPRLYHSASLLLPDATVLFVGGNPVRGRYDSSIEIYTPAYLFDGDGNAAVRPAISDAPARIHFGEGFRIDTPNAADIASAVLVRPGSPTHAFDMDQRVVRLAFTRQDGRLTATAPPNGNIAPPGYYMLFLIDSHGVPSVARFVHLSVPPPNQAPVASMTQPAGDLTILPGRTVTFQGQGVDSDGSIANYAWSFPGGTPSSSADRDPGPIAYAAGGTYTATLTVTDDDGAVSTPVTRRIDVRDFGITTDPSTLLLERGQAGQFAAGMVSLGGYTGVVKLTLTGLPPGATASLAASSLAVPGGTTVTIATAPAVAPGLYPLTIAGTSGGTTHTATTALVIPSEFSVSLTPATMTVTAGTKAIYKVSVAGTPTGPVSLAVTGLPRLGPGKFKLATIPAGGSTNLTVTTKKKLVPGEYTFIVTGTSAGTVKSVTGTVVVR